MIAPELLIEIRPLTLFATFVPVPTVIPMPPLATITPWLTIETLPPPCANALTPALTAEMMEDDLIVAETSPTLKLYIPIPTPESAMMLAALSMTTLPCTLEFTPGPPPLYPAQMPPG